MKKTAPLAQSAPLELTVEAFASALDRSRRISLDDLVEDTHGLPAGFRPTVAFSTVLERVQYARKIRTPLALVTGAHGAGKSTALRFYAQQQGVRYWECPPRYEARHVLADIAQRLGISAGTGWRMQTAVVVEQLREEPGLFLLDEAQRLDYEGCDLLKYIADQSESTFVLAASPSLEQRIRKWPDIDSRCGVKARVSAMTLEEFTHLYAVDGFNAEALAEMHRVSKGIYRNVKYLLAHLFEAMNEVPGFTPTKVTPGHVRKLAEKVFS